MKFEIPKIFERNYYVTSRVNGQVRRVCSIDLDHALLDALDLCRVSDNAATQVIIEDRIFGKVVKTDAIDARNIADYVRLWYNL